MARKYDSSRRAEAARKTREAILAAAFELHGRGVLDLESLAAEANVSVATVRKHFPTREALFQGCTAYGAHVVPLPDVEAIAGIEDPAERTREAVAQVYAVCEALFGHVWGAFKLEDESATMAAVLAEMGETLAAIARTVVAGWRLPSDEAQPLTGLVSGLLSPLTYRALRLHGGLSPTQAEEQAAAALIHALETARRGREQEAAYR